MDDSPDKVRRNLVVVSAALIISKFLGVNFSGSNLPILGDTLSVIGEKERIWWAVLFVWMYICYRFWTLKTTRENVSSSIREFKQKYNEQNEQEFKNSVIRAMSKKRSRLCRAAIIQKIDTFNNNEAIPIAHQKKITSAIKILNLSQTQPPVTIKKTYFKYQSRYNFDIEIDTSARYDAKGNTIDTEEEIRSFFENSTATKRNSYPHLNNVAAKGMADIEIPIWNSVVQFVATLIKTILSEKFSETFMALIIAFLGFSVAVSYIINPPHLTKPSSNWCQRMK
ncbi:hypothetical protein [Undibacterium sp. CY21W]|uniref:hypothetical protein n=1 Tax=Undibacterium sp. CY21W TaxID=2762293 RepID=UPI00164B5EDF|nr:hypothetical protein [Undibacterium sp. CY21W]MBC3929221.1 hypothetical protein [Undibacterium sp. CY21W]